MSSIVTMGRDTDFGHMTEMPIDLHKPWTLGIKSLISLKNI